MHIVELPDKTRVAQYNSPPVTEAEATEAVLASYAAAGEILQVAETTARHLGQSARSLLEMAITRLTNAEQRENNSDN